MNNDKQTNLKEFKIPVNWQLFGHVTVEAEDVESALEKALHREYIRGEKFGLPDNGEYIDGSFEIEEDMELIRYMNKDTI